MPAATPSTPKPRAAAYVRISEAKPDEDETSDDGWEARQVEDCETLAARNGWTIARTYAERDTSAYKRRKIRLPDGRIELRVIRPRFREMLDAVERGDVEALVVYDLDRIARDPRDLEDLIDLVSGKLTGREIPTASVTGNLDLSNASGILVARINVAVANKSSDDTGRRVARKHLQLAQQGKVGGGGSRPYGYGRDRHTIIEAEAAVIRDAARRIIGGASLTSIAKDLNARGVPTAGRATRWTSMTVHTAVAKARNAGLRVHRGEVIGKAVWPAILDEVTWRQVCWMLEGRSVLGSNNRLVGWLTGVLHCSACGRALTLTGRNGRMRRRGYRCWSTRGGCGKIAVDAEHCHDTVTGWILDYLTRKDVLAELSAATSPSMTGAAQSQAREDEALLKELAHQVGNRQITMPEYLEARKPIVERLNRSTHIMRAVLPVGARKLLHAADVHLAWPGLEPSEKRDVARLIFPGGINVSAATAVRRDSKGRSVFDPTRLVPNRAPQ